jgi:RNA polymerase sigma-70 factor (ECF subfamily)
VDDFDRFYRDEYGSVLRTVSLALGDATRAEEVTQEAFVRALRRWRRVGTMANPAGWVVVVAVNADRRRWARESGAPAHEATPVLAADDHASAVATSLDLREALARLTGRQRAAIVLRYLIDLPISDIATALGCAEGTAKATLHQALAILRVDLDRSDHER